MTSAGSTPAAATAAGTARAQHVDVVVGHLQRPLGRQRRRRRGSVPVEDGVRVLVHGAAQLGAVADPHDDGPAGQRAEVDADDDGGREGAVCGAVNEGAFRVGRRAFGRLV